MKRKLTTCFLVVCGRGLLTLRKCAEADAPVWMHVAANSPLPTYDSKTSAVLLYSEDVTTVSSDGKMKGIERRVYKILRPEGREYAVAYAMSGVILALVACVGGAF